MASSFPGAIDNFTDPLANSSLASPSHAGQHSDLNDAVEKIETYMGLVKVIPTAATNGTIAANGTVTITNGSSSVSVTCFSSLYDVYKIVVSGAAGSAASGIQLRLGSTSTGYYASGYTIPFSGAAALSQTNNGAQFPAAGVMTTDSTNAEITLNGPFNTQRTYYSSAYIYGATTGGGDAFTVLGYLNDATSYSAFTLIPVVGTLGAATIRVYGYRN